jgi:aminopeptidase N
MQGWGARQEHSELKQLVVEASRALARLDAERLEELALSCQALNRGLAPVNAEERETLARQAREAASDMAVFARVLEATRANLNVMNRLLELRAGRLEYGEAQARGWAGTESGHGND